MYPKNGSYKGLLLQFTFFEQHPRPGRTDRCTKRNPAEITMAASRAHGRILAQNLESEI